jgi:hypothetical protein
MPNISATSEDPRFENRLVTESLPLGTGDAWTSLLNSVLAAAVG